MTAGLANSAAMQIRISKDSGLDSMGSLWVQFFLPELLSIIMLWTFLCSVPELLRNILLRTFLVASTSVLTFILYWRARLFARTHGSPGLFLCVVELKPYMFRS